jgi:hypothetical protein
MCCRKRELQYLATTLLSGSWTQYHRICAVALHSTRFDRHACFLLSPPIIYIMQVNAAVDDMATFAEAVFKLLKAPRKGLSQDQLSRVLVRIAYLYQRSDRDLASLASERQTPYVCSAGASRNRNGGGRPWTILLPGERYAPWDSAEAGQHWPRYYHGIFPP